MVNHDRETYLPFEGLADVGEMHLNAVLVFVCLQIHLAETTCLLEFLGG